MINIEIKYRILQYQDMYNVVYIRHKKTKHTFVPQ